DAHRPLEKHHDLAAILSHVEQRRVNNDYTFPLDAKVYQIARQDVCTGLRGAFVRVEKRRDGSVATRFRDRHLSITQWAERPKVTSAKPGCTTTTHFPLGGLALEFIQGRLQQDRGFRHNLALCRRRKRDAQAVLQAFQPVPGEPPPVAQHGHHAGRRLREAGVPILLNISSQNSYAVFCFIKRGLNSAMRPAGAMVQPRLVVAAGRGKQVALGQTASAAYAGRTTRGGPAASGFAGSLAVHVAGTGSGDPVPCQHAESLARHKVNAVANSLLSQSPTCARCRQPMQRHDTETVSWVARLGRLHATVARYRCPACKGERRPLLDLLGVEPGRISGSLARLLALLAVVAPYTLAAQWAWLRWGVKISPMSVWKVVQRLGESAAGYSEGMSRYHADSRSEGASTREAPPAVVLSVDGSMLGMQVLKQRRRRTGAEPLPPLPPVKEGQFQEVKTGVLLLPSERVETSPGRH